jgi:hypothetical protein
MAGAPVRSSAASASACPLLKLLEWRNIAQLSLGG